MAKNKNIYKKGKSIFTKAKGILKTQQNISKQKKLALIEYKNEFSKSSKLIEYEDRNMTNIHTWETVPVNERKRIIKKLSKKYPLVKKENYPKAIHTEIRMAEI